MKQWTSAMLLAVMVSAVTGAAAHGNDHHVTKPGVATKEQMAWGIAGDRNAAARTVDVAMSDDMRFAPDRIEVRQGESIRFVVRNVGKVAHEFVIGTRKALDEHAALMARYPTMEHDEPYMAHVAPGGRAEIVWTFNRVGDFDFACLIGGHYAAGMTGTIKVVRAGNRAAQGGTR